MRTKNTFSAILLTFLVQVPTSPSDLNGAKEKDTEVVRRIKSTGEKLSWGRIYIGATVKEVQSVLKEKIIFGGRIDTGCGGVEAHVFFDNHRISINFSGDKPDSRLNGIFIPLQAKWTTIEIVGELKKIIPDLRYQPSRHQPDLTESKNSIPILCIGKQA